MHNGSAAGAWAASHSSTTVGDHKTLGRTGSALLALGTAYNGDDDGRYVPRFIAQLEEWLRANPPLRGSNWSSMLELEFRTI